MTGFKSFYLWLALAMPALTQAQPTVTVIATFPPSSGYYVPSLLMQAGGGNFFGTTKFLGANDCGTVFLMTPQGGLKILYSFDTVHGCYPNGPLVEGRNGYLYGTTVIGGSSGEGGVFKTSRAGATQSLYDFCQQPGCVDGANPLTGLIRGVDGSLYGVTKNGGDANNGVAFRVGPKGTYAVLHSFNHPNHGLVGMYLNAPLLQASDGNLYGLSGKGGAYGRGTIFMVAPDGQAKLFYSFGAMSNSGWGPIGSLIQANDGNLYGATLSGGANGSGTIFKISLQGAYTKIYDVPAGWGFLHEGPVQASDGNLWGIINAASVYAITTSGSLVQNFNLGTAGIAPETSLTLGSDGRLYGAGNFNNRKEGIYAIDAGLAPPAPTIAGFVPTSGLVGSTVVVSGEYFVGATAVTFNGVSASFVVNAAGVITTTVPPSATSGPITVTTAGGVATTLADFTVLP